MESGVPIRVLQSRRSTTQAVLSPRVVSPRPAPPVDLEAAREVLGSGLSSGTDRASALRAVVQRGEATAKDALRTYVASDRGLHFAAGDASARHAALECARSLEHRDRRVYKLTAEALGDASAEVRLAAVGLVRDGLDKGEDGAAPLAATLPFDDADDDVAIAAMRVFSTLAAAKGNNPLLKVRPAWRAACATAADGAATVDRRVAALEVLEAAPTASSAADLHAALATAMLDDEPRVRHAALNAAAVAPAQAVDRERLKLLARSDPDATSRAAAQYALICLDLEPGADDDDDDDDDFKREAPENKKIRGDDDKEDDSSSPEGGAKKGGGPRRQSSKLNGTLASHDDFDDDATLGSTPTTGPHPHPATTQRGALRSR